VSEINLVNHEFPLKRSTSNNMVREAKILTIARLAKMLVDLFGLDEPFLKVKKHFNEEIEMYLKDLDGYITFVLSKNRENFECFVGRAKNPKARLIINVKEEFILKLLSDIIRLRGNLLSLIKLLKYLIIGKVKIKGSINSAIKFVKCIMIGKNEIYKK